MKCMNGWFKSAVALVALIFGFAAHADNWIDHADAAGVSVEGDVYTVNTEAGLAWIAKQVHDKATDFAGKTVKLSKDLDLTGKLWTSIAETKANPFGGVFDGDGHTIAYKLTAAYRDDADDIGDTLFGYVYGADAANKAGIKNLTVSVTQDMDDFQFLKKSKFAGVVIATKYAEVSDVVTTEAQFSIVKNSERVYAGGIAVYDYGGSIYTRCTNNISIAASNYVLPEGPGSQWAQYFTFGGIAGRTEIETPMFTVFQSCANHGSCVQANPYDIDMTGKTTGYFAQRTVYGGIVGQVNCANSTHQVILLDCTSDGTCRGSGNCYWNGSAWQNADSDNHGSRGYFVGERWVAAGADGYQKYGVEGTSDWVADFYNTICWGQRFYLEGEPIDVGALTEEALAEDYPAADAMYVGHSSHYFIYNDGTTTTTLNDNTEYVEHFRTISDCSKLVGTFASYSSGNAPVVIFGTAAAPASYVAQVITNGGATTNKFANLNEALVAAKTAGSVCELLGDVALTGNWEPVANFQGIFDGKGYTISGLNVNAENGAALIAGTGQVAEEVLVTVKNVTIQSPVIKGANYTGVVFGNGFRAAVSNVTVVAANVTGAEYVGGIAGAKYCDVIDCTVINSKISGSEQVGGVIGFLCDASIVGCVATNNTITASESRAGGLAGKLSVVGESYFNDNIVSGTATCTAEKAGGIAGQIMGAHDHTPSDPTHYVYYEIKNNTIDVALTGNEVCPIGSLRSDSLDSFKTNLAANVTGNTWTAQTYPENSYTYTYTTTGEVPGQQTIYNGELPAYVAQVLEISGATTNLVGQYETLAEAVAAVEDGQTVKLLADTAPTSTMQISAKAVTLDLGGHDISFSAAESLFKLVSAGQLALVGTGTIDVSTYGSIGVNLYGNNGESVTVGENVTIQGFKPIDVGYVAVAGGVSTTINVDGTLIWNNQGAQGEGGYIIHVEGMPKNVEINVSATAKLLMRGFNTNSSHIMVSNPNATGTVNISGGIFNVYSYELGQYCYPSGKIQTYNMTLNITGGYFQNTVTPASGYACVLDNTQEGCQYKVRQLEESDYFFQNARTKVKYTNYETARDNAQTGDTLLLLQDLNASNLADAAGKSLTIDLQNHSVTCSSQGFQVRYGGSLTLANGQISSSSETFLVINGSLVLDGVTASSTGSYCVYLDTWQSTKHPASLTIRGASTLTTSAAAQTIVLYGCTEYTGTLTVESGVIKNDGGKAAINASSKYQPTSAIISGGAFGPITTYNVGSWTITGGIFASNPSSYVAEGYEVIDNPDPATVAAYPYAVVEASRTIEVTPLTVQEALDSAKKGDTIVLTAGEYDVLYLRNNGSDANRIFEDVTIKVKAGDAVTVDQIAYEKTGSKTLDIENLVIDGITFDDPIHSAVLFDVDGAGSLRVNGLTVQNCSKTGDGQAHSVPGKYDHGAFIDCCYDGATAMNKTFAGDTTLTCGYHDIKVIDNAITNVCQPIKFPNDGPLYGLTVSGNIFSGCQDNHMMLSTKTTGAVIIENNEIVDMTGRFARISGAQSDAAFTITNNTVTTPRMYDTGGDGSIFKITGAVGFTVAEADNQWKPGEYSSGNSTWIAMGDESLFPVAQVTVGGVTTKYASIEAAVAAFNNMAAGDYVIEVIKAGTYTLTNCEIVQDPNAVRTLVVKPADGIDVTLAGTASSPVSIFTVNGKSSVFTDAAVTFEGLTFDLSTGVNAISAIAGEEKRYAHNLTVTNCTFSSTTAGKGYIFAAPHNSCPRRFLVVDCTCDKINQVGSGYFYGNPLDTVNPGLDIANTTFTGCKAILNNQGAGSWSRVRGVTANCYNPLLIQISGGNVAAKLDVFDSSLTSTASTDNDKNKVGMITARYSDCVVNVSNTTFTAENCDTLTDVWAMDRDNGSAGGYGTSKKSTSVQVTVNRLDNGASKVLDGKTASSTYCKDSNNTEGYGEGVNIADMDPVYVAEIVETGAKYSTLADAIGVVADGETIAILTNITATGWVKVDRPEIDFTIDLCGMTIERTDGSLFDIYSKVTFKDSVGTGLIKAHGRALYGNSGADFTLESGTVMGTDGTTVNVIGTYGSSQKCIFTMNGGTVTSTVSEAVINLQAESHGAEFVMNGGTVNAAGCGISCFGNNTANGSKITVNGGTVNAAIEGISVNGSKDGSVIAVNGGEINGVDGCGIYAAQACVTVTDGAIAGSEAIVIKGGSLAVSGGELTAIGAAYDPADPGDSAYAKTGDALYVEDNYNISDYSFYHTISVNITGGSFTSVNGNAVSARFSAAGKTPTTVTVAGGRFKCANGKKAFSTTDFTGTISASGGIYSVEPEDAYIVSGKVAAANPDSETCRDYPWAVLTSYAVTFTTDKGTAPEATNYVLSATMTPLPKPTNQPDGLTFSGWLIPSLTESYMAIPAGMTGALALTATWTNAQKIAVKETEASAEPTVEIKVTQEWIDENVTPAGEKPTTAEIQTELNKKDENGNLKWQNYVIGLDPTNNVAGVMLQNDDEKTVAVVANVDTPQADTGFTVKYSLDQVETNGTVITAGAATTPDNLDIDLDGVESNAFFKVNVIVTKDDGTGEATKIAATNTLGVLKVTKAPATSIVAVPWDEVGGTAVTVANYVKTASLSEGDELYVYTTNGTYSTWALDEDKVWYYSGQGKKDPAEETIARGSAVWVRRRDSSKPLVLFGQASSASSSTSLDKKKSDTDPSWNIVAAPTVAPIDLNERFNADTKEGVTQDQVIVPTDGPPKNYTFVNGAWGYNETHTITNKAGKVIGTKVRVTDDTKIPAGTGFWYLNRGDATEVKW